MDIESNEVSNDSEVSPETSTETNSPSWWIDDNTAGAGDRPEWLPEKFKTVADMSKSYSELEKRFGSSPSEYDLSKAEGVIDAESDAMKNILDTAKQRGVPQDFIDSVFDNLGSHLKSQRVDPVEERKKLGDDPDSVLNELNSWAKSNLSEGAFEALTKSMTTAESVQAVMELKNKMSESLMKVPLENGEKVTSDDSVEKIESDMMSNRDKYNSDPSYRKEIRSRMSKLVSDEPIPLHELD